MFKISQFVMPLKPEEEEFVVALEAEEALLEKPFFSF